MNPFEILSPATLESAHDLLRDLRADAAVFAGGTDILGEIKEGTASPAALVDITGIDGLDSIEQSHEGTSIGSLVTLATIAEDPEIGGAYPALSQAAASVATPQIRNVGTLGGNLCQRPRCWYYRSPQFDCLKKGGDTCFAISGMNRYHAILGGDGCHIVHPSDTAVALLALGASVEIFGAHGLRRVPAAQFFVGPDKVMLTETVIDTADILTRVLLPPPLDGARSIYLKAKERQAYDFALASVAGYLVVRDGTIADAHFALGGVAPVPYPLPAVSDAIRGVSTDDVDPAALGRLAVHGAQPMSDNGYKVRLASNLVARAITTLLT